MTRNQLAVLVIRCVRGGWPHIEFGNKMPDSTRYQLSQDVADGIGYPLVYKDNQLLFLRPEWQLDRLPKRALAFAACWLIDQRPRWIFDDMMMFGSDLYSLDSEWDPEINIPTRREIVRRTIEVRKQTVLGELMLAMSLAENRRRQKLPVSLGTGKVSR